MTPEDLMQIPGVGEKTVERIRRVVTDYFERDQSGEGAASGRRGSRPSEEEGERTHRVKAAASLQPPRRSRRGKCAAADESAPRQKLLRRAEAAERRQT